MILTRIRCAKACSLADIQVIQDQLTEHHISPREPFARVESWVVHVEAFMHDTCPPITSNQLIQQEFLLCLISCCQTLDRKGNGPDIAIEGVRTPETASVFSLIEVGIFRAQNGTTSSLVNFIIDRTVAQIGRSQQTWYIWIIHDASIS